MLNFLEKEKNKSAFRYGWLSSLRWVLGFIDSTLSKKENFIVNKNEINKINT